MAGQDVGHPMTARALAARWALGAIMAVGALVLLVKPGGLSKVLALVLAGGAIAMFVRRNRGDATVVAVLLLAIAGFYLVLSLTGHADWITDRYSG